MEWYDIVFDLMDDLMIQSCGCDGVLDAYNTLKGLLGMSELMNDYDRFDDEFIVEAINRSIDARNRYTPLNGWKKITHVVVDGGKFNWSDDDDGQ